jgi:hypothetical protein
MSEKLDGALAGDIGDAAPKISTDWTLDDICEYEERLAREEDERAAADTAFFRAQALERDQNIERESRLHRKARKLGYRLRKSRTPPGFDYSQLDQSRARVARDAARTIRTKQQSIRRSAIALGAELERVKKSLPHGRSWRGFEPSSG